MASAFSSYSFVLFIVVRFQQTFVFTPVEIPTATGFYLTRDERKVC